MPGVFYLTDDLSPTGPGFPVTVLAPELARRFPANVVTIRSRAGTPSGTDFPEAAVTVRHLADVSGWRKLRSWARACDPGIIHSFGPRSARYAWFLTWPRIGLARTPRRIVSAADRAEGGGSGWLTRRAVRSADAVIAATQAEAERYRRLGVPPDRVVVVPPGVPESPPVDPVAFRRSLDIPETGRLVLAAGRFDDADGLKAAVWAFDVVKYAAPDLYLVLVGNGPERGRIERFGKALGFDDYRIRFADDRPDVPALARLAEIVWVTAERGGVAVALAGMAAGRPVVAVHSPDLAEVVEDGATGRLVPVNDRIQLAAVTNELLERPDLARAFGAAGRDRAAGFSAAGMVDRYARVYDGLLSGSTCTA